jgi:hypothetical protein
MSTKLPTSQKKRRLTTTGDGFALLRTISAEGQELTLNTKRLTAKTPYGQYGIQHPEGKDPAPEKRSLGVL